MCRESPSRPHPFVPEQPARTRPKSTGLRDRWWSRRRSNTFSPSEPSVWPWASNGSQSLNRNSHSTESLSIHDSLWNLGGTVMATHDEVREAIEDQRARIREVIEKAQADLDALDRVAAIFGEDSSYATRTAKAWELVPIDPDELRGMSVFGAAIAIAEANHGLLLSSAARALMVRAGILAEENNAASTVIYNAVNSSERFEKTGKRGEYRLLADQDAPEESRDREREVEVITRMPTAFTLR